MSGNPASSDGVVRAALAEPPRDALTSWLLAQRWFADKGRDIAAVEIEDLELDRVGSDIVALCVVRVDFVVSEPARYFVPLALVTPRASADRIAEIAIDGESWHLTEASSLPWFGDWFRNRFPGGGRAARDRWVFAADPLARDLLAASGQHSAELMGAEQSNTSIRFGDAMILKLIRRLQPGPNPDEEVLRALAGHHFPSVPRYVGGASWRGDDGASYPIALVQAFVPNLGDGWSWTLARLADIANGTVDPLETNMEPERLLGQRTGEMHIALSGIADAEFAPRHIRPEEMAEDSSRVRAAGDEAFRLLQERESHLPGELQRQLPEIAAAMRSAMPRASGFGDEAGTSRIRVHGDYHLGQTLRTLNDDWTIVDFEGEPARPVAERRRHQSALKDVAGMLRSFSYARGVAERAARDAGNPRAASRLDAWERRARDAFLAGYRGAIAKSSIPLAPADDAAFAHALAAWELDKALYEIAYEARNRPDWIAIPLQALVDTQTAQDAGDPDGEPAWP